MSKYIVYRNDLKFKKHRKIDPKCAEWTDDIKNVFLKYNTDSIEYRIQECIQEKLETLDLSHMSQNCFEEFIEHPQYDKIRKKVQHIFAQSSNLCIIPNLHQFTKLVTLDISDNNLININTLPISLEELILNNNKLTSLTYDLPNLKRLKISNNKILDIKLSDSLESAYLDNNPLNNIPHLYNIKYLNISNTYIKYIHSYPKLEILDCYHTNIRCIPKMDTLKELNCSYSRITDISELKYLESLEMINTHIKNIHFMDSLYIVKYHSDDKFKISRLYKIKQLTQNKKKFNELTFHA
jgi:Leucine-rich repeat (LRR) protein